MNCNSLNKHLIGNVEKYENITMVSEPKRLNQCKLSPVDSSTILKNFVYEACTNKNDKMLPASF
jgi:hypothetical protein